MEEIAGETKKGVKAGRIESCQAKEQQSKFYSEQEKECHLWLTQNLNLRKTAAIMMMLEQMVETRSWKQTRGLIEDGRCRVCFQHSKTVEHLIAGCQKLAFTVNEYLSRCNRVLMILAVAWAKEHGLISQYVVWYEQRWDRGIVFENERAKLVWDFEFHLRKATTKKTRYNPGKKRRQKDLDMQHGVPAATEHQYGENGKVDEI